MVAAVAERQKAGRDGGHAAGAAVGSLPALQRGQLAPEIANGGVEAGEGEKHGAVRAAAAQCGDRQGACKPCSMRGADPGAPARLRAHLRPYR